MKRTIALISIMVFVTVVSGCAVNFYKGKPGQEAEIRALRTEIDELELAKAQLEEKLAKEIGNKQILLEMSRGGLVITMANDILFDSGKAKLKRNSYSVLDKIASVLQSEVPERNIGVEGHTDNVPIKYSGWKSNWELSAARATSVLHYLIDKCGIAPQRLSAIGYGEYRPIDMNDTKDGRARNRRVEIIILPKETTKKSYEEAQSRISEEARQAEEARPAGQEAVK